MLLVSTLIHFHYKTYYEYNSLSNNNNNDNLLHLFSTFLGTQSKVNLEWGIASTTNVQHPSG